MKIAIPTAQGKLTMHFGHCETFTLTTVENNSINASEDLKAPPHEPGLLPRWLAEKNVDLIIAGGMGQRAQQLFADQGIKVIVGAPSESSETLVNRYLEGNLTTGTNLCDH
ncbi:MAG: NifB/NifX family molybdenum-iron cluster-binding protein [Thermodesulfobacteriota bacterium]|nr:NifB/NifX family molybdenum-iron cluster-binding protein [Thermodesulfobacteriota bacterium]